MKKMFTNLVVCLLASVLFIQVKAQTGLPYFPKRNNFGGSSVASPVAFVPTVSDFTLEGQGTAGAEIKIVGLGISHTPAATGTVRFVGQGNMVYVYENKVFAKQYVAVPQGVAVSGNLLPNGSFEQATLLGTGRWSADGWDALTETGVAWGTGSTTSIREGTNVSDGIKSLIFHSNARALTQQLPAATLASNTLYQLSYNFWTSTGTGTGGATYQVQLGTTSTGTDVQTLPGHTTLASDFTQKSFSTVFQTNTIPSGAVWLTLYRSLSKVDWLDNLKLVQISGLQAGLTGLTAATYLSGTAYAPEDPTLAEQGGTTVDLTNFLPPAGDYTLEVQATTGMAIGIPSIAISYTPTVSGLVRFVSKNGVISIYENGVFTGRDTAVMQVYTVETTNRLLNPSFEQVGTPLATGNWIANNWDALTTAKTSAWGAGSTTNVRENATYRSDGVKSIIMHTNLRYLTQQLPANTLTSNTVYQLSYDYWTSAGATNGGATYQIQLGTTSAGSEVQTLAGHTTSTTDYTKKSFSKIFQTPIISGAAWFTLNRVLSRVDWLDNLKLSKVNGLTTGITGTSSATLKTDTTIYPRDERYDAYTRLQKATDYATKVLGWYQDEPAKKDTLQPPVDTARITFNDFTHSAVQIDQVTTRLVAVTKFVDKKTYIPTSLMGDMTDTANAWSNSRSVQSKDWILFWEKGFNTEDPTKLIYGSYYCDVDWMLGLAQTSFHYYADSLKFITKGNSKTDTYKMIIRVRYTGDFEATGSGVDNLIGLLTITPQAYNSSGGQSAAHEVGHCFQYQVHCDNNDQNGWMYGFGPNASGGNGWWEQCAQWQSYKVFPAMQFTSGWLPTYLGNVHKHPLHETPRYANYFIHDYWSELHGRGVIGRLWNESVKPEDPIEAYKRLYAVSQTGFNDEMYTCAAKFATWDIDSLRARGAGFIASRPQPKLNDIGSNFWRIDSTVCPENYGHNIIKLNVPSTATAVAVNFQGLAGSDGFRKNYVSEAGWRYGFVALLNDGTRVYGDMKTADMATNAGAGFLTFQCPANCTQLWLVVSGAPKSYWRHAWDDNNANDEQWPYQVKFGNTNLLGQTNIILPVVLSSFIVKPVGQTAVLNWLVSSQTNNKGFYIERSADGRMFGTIGFVVGAGTTNQAVHYAYTDGQLLTGINYYRLRQVDADGKATYSAIQSVFLNGAAALVNVYPTSFTNTLYIKTGVEKGVFNLRDAAGHMLKKVAIGNGTTLELNVADVPTGVYFWQLNGQSGKLVKQ